MSRYQVEITRDALHFLAKLDNTIDDGRLVVLVVDLDLLVVDLDHRREIYRNL